MCERVAQECAAYAEQAAMWMLNFGTLGMALQAAKAQAANVHEEQSMTTMFVERIDIPVIVHFLESAATSVVTDNSSAGIDRILRAYPSTSRHLASCSHAVEAESQFGLETASCIRESVQRLMAFERSRQALEAQWRSIPQLSSANATAAGVVGGFLLGLFGGPRGVAAGVHAAGAMEASREQALANFYRDAAVFRREFAKYLEEFILVLGKHLQRGVAAELATEREVIRQLAVAGLPDLAGAMFAFAVKPGERAGPEEREFFLGLFQWGEYCLESQHRIRAKYGLTD